VNCKETIDGGNAQF